ncbi:MAG: hypothetical protein ACT4R6_09605 [Gemmatimonadaceae bacterium]
MPLTRAAPPAATVALLAHAVDYAGLFPPASLDLAEAVREYAAQRSGNDAWALGRFVCDAMQLQACAAERRKAATLGDPWPVSVLSTGDVAGDVNLIALVDAGVLRVAAIEAKGPSVAAVMSLRPLLDAADELYVEVAPDERLNDCIAAVRAIGARAKIRTGGVTPDAFPSSDAVAAFMRACVAAGVAFKATAGLHHLIRGEYPLTYRHDSARGTMFGYLGVLSAAALARRGVPHAQVIAALEERSRSAFRADESALCWRDVCLTVDELGAARADTIAGFGSCSFREPIAELADAGLAAA